MGVAISGAQYLWPNARVPYEVDPAFPDPQRVVDAVAEWNGRTVIRFEPRSGENDYLLIMPEAGCAISDVGRRGGEQRICIGDSCTAGQLAHELGHTVGLWHEHCRHDRDAWVSIVWNYIEDGCEDNFKIDFIDGTAAATDDIGAYDYGSIMHYGAYDFAVDDQLAVMTALKAIPSGVTMGQRDALSDGDIAAVSALYAGVAPARR
ncbi:MAG: M12 family metallopeptidase [Alphaproteobacteria bacterium]|nr:M12 family metallopeptidase [Alphaproteobacteria bacterium]